jgi:hypothetical protein
LPTSTPSLHLCTATKKWPLSLHTSPASVTCPCCSALFFTSYHVFGPCTTFPCPRVHLCCAPGSVIRVLRRARVRLPLLSVTSLAPAPTPFHFVCAVAGVLMCLLSSPPPAILHFHAPATVGNGRGTGNGHSPLHSMARCSTRVRLSALPLRGPPWPAVVRRPPWPAARRVLPCMYYCMLST